MTEERFWFSATLLFIVLLVIALLLVWFWWPVHGGVPTPDPTPGSTPGATPDGPTLGTTPDGVTMDLAQVETILSSLRLYTPGGALVPFAGITGDAVAIAESNVGGTLLSADPFAGSVPTVPSLEGDASFISFGSQGIEVFVGMNTVGDVVIYMLTSSTADDPFSVARGFVEDIENGDQFVRIFNGYADTLTYSSTTNNPIHTTVSGSSGAIEEVVKTGPGGTLTTFNTPTTFGGETVGRVLTFTGSLSEVPPSNLGAIYMSVS